MIFDTAQAPFLQSAAFDGGTDILQALMWRLTIGRPITRFLKGWRGPEKPYSPSSWNSSDTIRIVSSAMKAIQPAAGEGVESCARVCATKITG